MELILKAVKSISKGLNTKIKEVEKRLEKMETEPPKDVYYFNVIQDGDGYAVNLSYEEFEKLYSAGRIIALKYVNYFDTYIFYLSKVSYKLLSETKYYQYGNLLFAMAKDTGNGYIRLENQTGSGVYTVEHMER
jgi:hypothetical protein